jgi:hypothetical protein
MESDFSFLRLQFRYLNADYTIIEKQFLVKNPQCVKERDRAKVFISLKTFYIGAEI